jgi:hypothetical protein
MAITSVMPVSLQEADGVVSEWAKRLIGLIMEAEALATWGKANLLEANRTGDNAILILGYMPDKDDNMEIKPVSWTSAQLAGIQAQFQAAEAFATWARAGGASSPLAKLQEIARPGGPGMGMASPGPMVR